MFYAGFDMLFSILFPILFLVVLGMILYTIIGNISTWNKNNHSPQLCCAGRPVIKASACPFYYIRYITASLRASAPVFFSFIKP